MDLVRLIYVSKALDVENLDLKALINQARENNASTSVTGMLWFNGEYFLQALEGSRENVNRTYNSIIKDSRHKNVQLISFEYIDERSFADWSMGYFSDLIKNRELISNINMPEEFRPELIGSEAAMSMLLPGADINMVDS